MTPPRTMPRRVRTTAIVLVSASCALAVTLLGCGLNAPETLPPRSVADEVEGVTGVPLARVKSTDAANMANVVATYQGSGRRQTVLVVVFDSPRATVQLVGRAGGRFRGEVAGRVIVQRNVAVFYRSASGSSRADEIRRALAELAAR